MTTLLSLLVKLGVDSGDFDKGLGDAEQQTNRFKSNVVGNLASVGNAALATFAGLAAGAVTGFGAMAKEGIEMNKFLELSKLQFTTLMGSADEASKHVEMLFKVAASTPFEANQIIGASKSLLTFGGAALDTEKNILMVGDAAAATGADIGEVSNWVGRAYSAIQAGRPFGEAAQRLQEMGILSADARNELERLQKSGASSATVWAYLTKTFGKFD